MQILYVAPMPCHYLLQQSRNVEQLSGTVRNKPFGRAALPSPTTAKIVKGCAGAVLIPFSPLTTRECIKAQSLISIELKIKHGKIFRKFEQSFAHCLSKKSQIFISLMSVESFQMQDLHSNTWNGDFWIWTTGLHVCMSHFCTGAGSAKWYQVFTVVSLNTVLYFKIVH